MDVPAHEQLFVAAEKKRRTQRLKSPVDLWASIVGATKFPPGLNVVYFDLYSYNQIRKHRTLQSKLIIDGSIRYLYASDLIHQPDKPSHAENTIILYEPMLRNLLPSSIMDALTRAGVSSIIGNLFWAATDGFMDQVYSTDNNIMAPVMINRGFLPQMQRSIKRTAPQPPMTGSLPSELSPMPAQATTAMGGGMARPMANDSVIRTAPPTADAALVTVPTPINTRVASSLDPSMPAALRADALPTPFLMFGGITENIVSVAVDSFNVANVIDVPANSPKGQVVFQLSYGMDMFSDVAKYFVGAHKRYSGSVEVRVRIVTTTNMQGILSVFWTPNKTATPDPRNAQYGRHDFQLSIPDNQLDVMLSPIAESTGRFYFETSTDYSATQPCINFVLLTDIVNNFAADTGSIQIIIESRLAKDFVVAEPNMDVITAAAASTVSSLGNYTSYDLLDAFEDQGEDRSQYTFVVDGAKFPKYPTKTKFEVVSSHDFGKTVSANPGFVKQDQQNGPSLQICNFGGRNADTFTAANGYAPFDSDNTVCTIPPEFAQSLPPSNAITGSPIDPAYRLTYFTGDEPAVSKPTSDRTITDEFDDSKITTELGHMVATIEGFLNSSNFVAFGYPATSGGHVKYGGEICKVNNNDKAGGPVIVKIPAAQNVQLNEVSVKNCETSLYTTGYMTFDFISPNHPSFSTTLAQREGNAFLPSKLTAFLYNFAVRRCPANGQILFSLTDQNFGRLRAQFVFRQGVGFICRASTSLHHSYYSSTLGGHTLTAVIQAAKTDVSLFLDSRGLTPNYVSSRASRGFRLQALLAASAIGGAASGIVGLGQANKERQNRLDVANVYASAQLNSAKYGARAGVISTFMNGYFNNVVANNFRIYGENYRVAPNYNIGLTEKASQNGNKPPTQMGFSSNVPKLREDPLNTNTHGFSDSDNGHPDIYAAAEAKTNELHPPPKPYSPENEPATSNIPTPNSSVNFSHEPKPQAPHQQLTLSGASAPHEESFA